MNKIICASLIPILFSMSAVVFAKDKCDLNIQADQRILKLLNNKELSFYDYDNFCRELRAANASIYIEGETTIAYSQDTAIAIATATARLSANEAEDQGLRLTSRTYQSYLGYKLARTSASEDEALYFAVNNAVSRINQTMLDELNEQRKSLKTYVDKK